MAQDAEAPAVTVSGSVAVVSDYRFRGITQTDKDFAVQAGVTVSHESGLYAGVWGSSVDEYIAAGSDQEIDLIVGYKKTFGATTLDVGGLYYYYPGSSKITPGTNSDFLELYTSLSQTIGPVSAKLAAFYSPKQAGLSLGAGKLDNFYMNLGLSGSIPDTGVSLSAGVGRTFTASYLSGGSGLVGRRVVHDGQSHLRSQLCRHQLWCRRTGEPDRQGYRQGRHLRFGWRVVLIDLI
jgi:uncharacterized protein (TIGR02001 family)